MANDLSKDEVMLAVTGALSTAPEGTKPAMEPVNGLHQPLSTPWFNRGYVGEDGVNESVTKSVDVKVAWQNKTPLRRVTTEAGATYTFRLLQVNRENIELVRGAKISSDGTVTVDAGVEHESFSWCIDIEDKNRSIRKWLPSAVIEEIAEVTYQTEELVGWEITISADRFEFEDGTSGHFKESYSDIEGEEPSMG